ncbi:hypothetical protein PG997_014910 [Apiospora hydei]|uniref:Uncharacterized protein n=1 Tax=Apiospora hydei TaxID=1337664 RepID=A0ABR1UV67_9PEZI
MFPATSKDAIPSPQEPPTPPNEGQWSEFLATKQSKETPDAYKLYFTSLTTTENQVCRVYEMHHGFHIHQVDSLPATTHPWTLSPRPSHPVLALEITTPPRLLLPCPPESQSQTTPGLLAGSSGDPTVATPAAKASRGRGRPPGRIAKARKGNQTRTAQGSIAHAFERLDRHDDKDGKV